MIGMHAGSGAPLSDLAHLHQSVADILTTPIGSRVMRRDYGSLLPELIDHPGTAANVQRLIAATAMAILRWEPRIKPSRIAVSINGLSGQALIEIRATRQDGLYRGEPVTLALNLNTGHAT